jgi:dTDP-4-amino-4,6-dideoxygalactose transaminase
MEEGLYKLYSLPDWYCNLALMEFSKLVNQLDHRKEIAKIYSSKLNKRIFNAGMAKMIPASANLRFPIFIENRNNLIAFLKKENIFVSDIWYDSVAPECPNAVDISTRILNLPTHINVSRKSAMRIADKINLWLKSQ